MKILINLAVLPFVAVVPVSALACSPATPPDYDAEAGSSAPPPRISIEDIEIDLGRNYGEPGPGDCSDLGTVLVTLARADGGLLDDDFGVELEVVSGDLPAAMVDLDEWVAPVRDNQVNLTIANSTNASVEFSIVARAVNTDGEVGLTSNEVSASRARGGCAATPVGATDGLTAAMVAGVLGLRARRARRRASGRD